MINLQTLTDKTAMGLSLICTIHCIVLPIAMVLLPSVAALSMDDARFHQWMLVAVVPTSLFALTMGCRKHKRYRIFLWGATGLVTLGLAAYLGHDTLGELGEKLLTLVGACIIAFGHLRNHRLCRRQPGQTCHT